MAADTMAVMDTHIKLLDEVKVWKFKGHLFGIAGEVCPTARDFKAWFFPQLGEPRRRPYGGTAKFDAMVVTPEGEIQVWDHRGVYEVIKLPFYAVGSGKEVCLGAMEMGADARKAVKAAIRWCPTVGGKVIWKRLK
jgi:hypothetical protein